MGSLLQEQVMVRLLVLCFCLTVLGAAPTSSSDTPQAYVVYMGAKAHDDSGLAMAENHGLLSSVLESSEAAQSAIVYHYSKSFRGFAAKLTQAQASTISKMNGVISVFPSRSFKLHTTRSWSFLGLTNAPQTMPMPRPDDPAAAEAWSSQSDVVIGMIDSGVWPESHSFNDYGMPPVPYSWNGECVPGERFTTKNCNRKIIGARFYSTGWELANGPLENVGKTFFRSARDQDGHGTHTASTAAGAVVHNASIFGIARGDATGGAPSARLAIYKACWFDDCEEIDILAAFDDALADGVHILSLSLGPNPPQASIFDSAISVGSFHAISQGVVVSCSAGNAGLPSSATNIEPWLITVAASSIDRDLESDVVLGDYAGTLKGEAVNPLALKNGWAGLVLGSAVAAPGVPAANASFCMQGTLDPAKVTSKIVVCLQPDPLDNRPNKSLAVQQAGGAGMILIDEITKDVGIGLFFLPSTIIGQLQGNKLLAYMKSTRNPTASITPTRTVLGFTPAPKMAVFSSQGPSSLNPHILKPDITAPGVSILAAWSPVALQAGKALDFHIISGTSMSCPHVSALAALIKAEHPTWSPAAIKSAIMTTASTMDNTNRPIVRSPESTLAGPFDFGSGHINPSKARDPGLLYDSTVDDLVVFLCDQGVTTAQLKNLTGNQYSSCPDDPRDPFNLNYPSIAVADLRGKASVFRTVTNCGQGAAIYKATVVAPPGVDAAVVPEELSFRKSSQKLSFTVELTVRKPSAGKYVFGSLIWSDGHHVVRSPIAVNATSI